MEKTKPKITRFTCCIRHYPCYWRTPEQKRNLPTLATFNFRWPTPEESNKIEGLTWWLTFPELFKKKIVISEFPLCPGTLITSPRMQLWIQMNSTWEEFANHVPQSRGFPGFILEKAPAIQEPMAREVNVLRHMIDNLFYTSYGRVKNPPHMPTIRSTMAQQISKLLSQKPDMKKEVDSLDGNLKTCETQLEKLETQNCFFAESLAKLKPQQEKIHNCFVEYEEKVDRLEKELQTRKSKYANTMEYQQCLKSLESLQSTLRETDEQLDELKKKGNQLAELGKDIAEIKRIL